MKLRIVETNTIKADGSKIVSFHIEKKFLWWRMLSVEFAWFAGGMSRTILVDWIPVFSTRTQAEDFVMWYKRDRIIRYRSNKILATFKEDGLLEDTYYVHLNDRSVYGNSTCYQSYSSLEEVFNIIDKATITKKATRHYEA